MQRKDEPGWYPLIVPQNSGITGDMQIKFSYSMLRDHSLVINRVFRK